MASQEAHVRRLHLRPCSAAILSSRMTGVLPTASSALSSIRLGVNSMTMLVASGGGGGSGGSRSGSGKK